jgi:hypothetical protein
MSPRTSSCASATRSPAAGLSCPGRGAAWPHGGKERSRCGTSPGTSRRSGRDRRQASSVPDGCGGCRASTSSSSTTRTYAEPTAVVREQTSMPWTRPCGATSAASPGSSRGDCAAQALSSSGREAARPSGHDGENQPRASPGPGRAAALSLRPAGRGPCRGDWSCRCGRSRAAARAIRHVTAMLRSHGRYALAVAAAVHVPGDPGGAGERDGQPGPRQHGQPGSRHPACPSVSAFEHPARGTRQGPRPVPRRPWPPAGSVAYRPDSQRAAGALIR